MVYHRILSIVPCAQLCCLLSSLELLLLIPEPLPELPSVSIAGQMSMPCHATSIFHLEAPWKSSLRMMWVLRMMRYFQSPESSIALESFSLRYKWTAELGELGEVKETDQ